MNRVLFLVNHDVVIYNFRRELVEKLIEEGKEVVISSPYGERIEILKKIGCKFVETKINRHGKNPIEDLKLFNTYKKMIRKLNPDIIFSYTIKPNIYGSIAAAACKVPIVANITGLGMAVEGKGMIQNSMKWLYKCAFRKVQTIFVQNTENQQYFIDNNLYPKKVKLLPGSGVNLEQYHVLDYPNDEVVKFVFISRIMKEKGIDQYLEMAEVIKTKYPNTEFHICGFCEENYEVKLKQLEKDNIIKYHGLVMDITEIIKDMHCTIHPTYYPEGMSNVLLESSACGRPIITTDRSGCREIIDDGVNGYMIHQKNTSDLINAVEKFLKLSNDKRRKMGLAGRKKVETHFDRMIVVKKYLEELEYRGENI